MAQNRLSAPNCLPVGVSLLVALLVTVPSALDTRAQSLSGEAVRAHWPDVLYETQAGAMNRPGAAAAEDFADTDILPFVDTLSLGWQAYVREDLPVIAFKLRWLQGEGGILDGRLADALPDSILLTSLDLHVPVELAQGDTGHLVLSLDSLYLPSGDYFFDFETAELGWGELFQDVDEVAARAAFQSGFTLGRLDILMAGFEAPYEEEALAADDREQDVIVTRRPPRRRAIFVPDTNIWIGWNLGPDRRRGNPRIRRGANRPRDGDMGRTSGSSDERRTRGGRDSAGSGGSDTGAASTAERSGGGGSATASTGSSSGSGETTAGDSSGETSSRSRGRRGISLPGSSDNDNEDDDDRDLLGPAIGAAAAIAGIAYFGGTFGYYGVSGVAPVGLSAGRITPKGGALLHAAINSDVLSGGKDEKMTAGLTAAFKPLFGIVQPTATLNMWFEEEGDTIKARPTLGLGGMVLGPGGLVLHGGYDLSEKAVLMGIAFRLRQ